MTARALGLLVALVLVPGCSRSSPNDPGYQGIAWGSPESVAIERGLHCSDVAGTRLCTGKGQLAGVTVTENFMFDEGGLRNVLVEAAPEAFVALKDSLSQKYGGSQIVERNGHKLLEWDTEATSISLENVGPETVAMFSSQAALRRDRKVTP